MTPLWILWLISVWRATITSSWSWSPLYGLTAAFGEAWEYRSAVCKDCTTHPVFTLYYRIQLFPPKFIDRPEYDCFQATSTKDLTQGYVQESKLFTTVVREA